MCNGSDNKKATRRWLYRRDTMCRGPFKMLFDDYRASVIGYISAANITQNIGFRKKPLLPRRETVCEVSTLSWSPQSLVYQGSSGGQH